MIKNLVLCNSGTVHQLFADIKEA